MIPDPATILAAMTGHAVVAVDNRGVVVFFSGGARRMHGFTEQIAGQATADQLFSRTPGGVDRHRGLVDSIPDWAAAPTDWIGEMRCCHASGIAFTAETVAAPYPSGSATPAGTVLVYRPAPIRADPTAPMAAPGVPLGVDVLSRLGHELRTPLANVIGLSRVMLMKISTGRVDPAQQRPHLEMIQRAANRSMTTIERVIDIAKIESGLLHCDRRPIDCRSAVAEATAEFRTAAEARGLRLRTALPDHPVVITTDTDILVRVLRELLDNAVKFAGAGDVLVRIRTGDDQPVLIEVSDDGPGIPVDDQVRIFAAFERGELAIALDDDGAGLGLYLARRLSALLDARLSVRSTTGEHTTFTVAFPTRASDPESQHDTQPRSRT